MDVSPERVRAERDRVRDRGDVVEVINDTRARLADAFETEVAPVTPDAYRQELFELMRSVE